MADNGGNPPSIMKATGKVADSVVAALGGQPMLLVVVLLNAAFLGAASWFLLQQESHRNEVVKQIIERCIPRPHAQTEAVH